MLSAEDVGLAVTNSLEFLCLQNGVWEVLELQSDVREVLGLQSDVWEGLLVQLFDKEIDIVILHLVLHNNVHHDVVLFLSLGFDDLGKEDFHLEAPFLKTMCASIMNENTVARFQFLASALALAARREQSFGDHGAATNGSSAVTVDWVKRGIDPAPHTSVKMGAGGNSCFSEHECGLKACMITDAHTPIHTLRNLSLLPNPGYT